MSRFGADLWDELHRVFVDGPGKDAAQSFACLLDELAAFIADAPAKSANEKGRAQKKCAEKLQAAIKHLSEDPYFRSLDIGDALLFAATHAVGDDDYRRSSYYSTYKCIEGDFESQTVMILPMLQSLAEGLNHSASRLRDGNLGDSSTPRGSCQVPTYGDILYGPREIAHQPSRGSRVHDAARKDLAYRLAIIMKRETGAWRWATIDRVVRCLLGDPATEDYLKTLRDAPPTDGTFSEN